MAKNKSRIISVNTFGGGADSDTAREFLDPSKYRYMLNCHTVSTAEGNVGIVRNVKGNVMVNVTLPSGFNKVIGAKSDEKNHKFIYHVYNSEGLHGIYQYDEISNTIILVLQSITDFAGVDVLDYHPDYLILMSDFIGANKYYWVDGGRNYARKINIAKCLDKSTSGYGLNVLEEYINAYKLAPRNAPEVSVFTDSSIPFNNQYGSLKKFVSRFIYDDGEKSHFSDYSNVALPPKESSYGINQIPSDNNGISIQVDTGSRIVVSIEIGMIYTIPTGISTWKSIAVLNKKKLNIGDNGQYTYKFYNDGAYPDIDPAEVVLPYSFLPDKPECQAFAGRTMTYTNFKEGFEVVDLDVSLETSYEDLFIANGEEDKFNSPSIISVAVANSGDYIAFNETITRIDGSTYRFGPFGKAGRANIHEIKVGSDVKAGNEFFVYFSNGGPDDFTVSYKALVTDTATTVLSELRDRIIASGKAVRKTPDGPDTNPYVNTDDGLGNMSFKIVMLPSPDKTYMGSSASVQPVRYSVLKDTGESVSNRKMGAIGKFGIVYRDKLRKRTLTYTNNNLIERVKTENELGGIKAVITTLTINHIPPIWAESYEIVRSKDLTYANFIQMLVQNVIEVPNNGVGEYLDLVVGSLATYQLIHPNSVLTYEFKAGDRIRFRKDIDDNYYNFFETEIISYKQTTEEIIKSNLTVTGNNIVTVAVATADNVGRIILVDNNEREIIARLSSSTYQLNAPIGKSGETQTFQGYTLIDRRGIARIRKPATSSIVITNNSQVEIYAPALSGDALGEKQFFHFNKQFNIINPGTANRYHGANLQQQTAVLPAKVKINEGTIYVRNRELPITNNVPGAQVIIGQVEDQRFSDFYQSLINNNGRDNIEDTGDGVVNFPNRTRYGKNYIENTRINGLNLFYNTDRKDFDSKYGDTKLTVYEEGQLLFFNEFRTGIVPVLKKIINDAQGGEILGLSSDFLNDIRWYGFEGGIGNNPESYCMYGNWNYYVSPNYGALIRIGGDGATPLSEVYSFDSYFREALRKAGLNNAKIFTQVDPKLSYLIVAIEQYEEKSYDNSFEDAKWNTLSNYVIDDETPIVTIAPLHGDVTFLNGFFNYVPDNGYVGADNFTYTVTIDGNVITRKVCLQVNEIANRQKIWIATGGSCVLVEGFQNGMYEWSTLTEVYQDDNSPTGVTKPNSPDDLDYVAPIQDVETCEVSGFGNEYQSETFYSEVCEEGLSPNPYLVQVAANTFFAATLADANQAALDYIEDNGQSLADENGTCSVGSYTLTPRNVDDGVSSSVVVELRDSIGNLVNVSADITFDYSIALTPSSPIAGSRTLLATTNTILLNTYDGTTYTYVNTTINNISPTNVDGHNIT